MKKFRVLLIAISFLVIGGLRAQLQEGDIAPDFTVTDLNGVVHNLYEYLDDGKYVLFKAGFPGCGTCEGSRPGWNNLYKNFGCNERDLIVLEFDVSSHDADIVPSLWINGNFASQSGTMVHDDIDYVFPEAPYITLDGGSQTIETLYELQWYSSDFLIEPGTKRIIGSSGDETTWHNIFANNYLEGWGNDGIPGFMITKRIEDQGLPLFHYIPANHMGDWVNDHNPDYDSPLGGALAVGETPFSIFCSGNLTGCDTIRPVFTTSSVTAENDSTYSLEVNWSGTSECDEFVLEYGMHGGGITEITTTSTSLTLTNLYPGKYTFSVKCACNQVYLFSSNSYVIEPETDFTVNSSCSEKCEYHLLPHGLLEEGSGGFPIPFQHLRVRVESEGMIEFYSHNIGNSTDYLGSEISGTLHDLTFCKNSDIDIRFIDPGASFGNQNGGVDTIASMAGFKFFDENDDLVIESSGSTIANPVVLDMSVHPGYFSFNTIVADCEIFVGLTEEEWMDISVYPIPFQNEVNLVFPNDISEAFTSVVVVNVLGEEVNFQVEKYENTMKLEFDPMMAKGTYFIKLMGVSNNKVIRVNN